MLRDAYSVLEDRTIESGAFDADYGPAESWPAWTDDARWTTSEPLPGEEVPIGTDDEYVPSPEDLESYSDWSREVEDRLLQARMQSDHDDLCERAAMFTEADARAAGLAI